MIWDQQIFVDNVLRLLGGRPQNELNRIAGRDAVTRWKKGDRPSLDVLLRVSEFFRCTLDDLVSIPDRDLLLSSDIGDNALTIKDTQKCQHIDPIYEDIETLLTENDAYVIGLLRLAVSRISLELEERKSMREGLNNIALALSRVAECLPKQGIAISEGGCSSRGRNEFSPSKKGIVIPLQGRRPPAWNYKKQFPGGDIWLAARNNNEREREREQDTYHKRVHSPQA